MDVQLLHQLVHTGLKQRLRLLTNKNKTESEPTGQSDLVACNRGALALALFTTVVKKVLNEVSFR